MIKEGEITVSLNYRTKFDLIISGVFSWSVPFEILLYCLIVTPLTHFIVSSGYSFAHEKRFSWNGGFWPKNSRYNKMPPYISHFSNPNQCFMRLFFSWPSGHIILISPPYFFSKTYFLCVYVIDAVNSFNSLSTFDPKISYFWLRALSSVREWPSSKPVHDGL